MKHKFELSLAVGLGTMLLWYAAPLFPMRWWSVAFSPLCDGVLTADGEGLLLRSGLLELLRSLPR